jgi:hypothetical protein
MFQPRQLNYRSRLINQTLESAYKISGLYLFLGSLLLFIPPFVLPRNTTTLKVLQLALTGSGIVLSGVSLSHAIRISKLEPLVRAEEQQEEEDYQHQLAVTRYYQETQRERVMETMLEQSSYPTESLQPAAPNTVTLPPINHPLAAIGQALIEALLHYNLPCDWVEGHRGPTTQRLVLKPVVNAQVKVKVADLKNRERDLQIALGLSQPPLIHALTQGVAFDLNLSEQERQFCPLENYISYQVLPDEEPVRMAMGVDLYGQLVEIELANPNTCHVLGGGATGSGKSEAQKAMLASLILRYPPERVQVCLIDVKRVTFAKQEFDALPWLWHPVCRDTDSALDLLENLDAEQQKRYERFEQVGANDLEDYNPKVEPKLRLPRIVCFIDEIQYLTKDKEVKGQFEAVVEGLGALARAAGIHLVLFTQYPKADVVSTKIKVNMGVRLGLRLQSAKAGAVILDVEEWGKLCTGLLGKGDLIFSDGGTMLRLQSLYVRSIQELLPSQLRGAVSPSLKPDNHKPLSSNSQAENRVSFPQAHFKSPAYFINWLKHTLYPDLSNYTVYQFSDSIEIQEILPQLEHLDSGLIPNDSGIFILHDADLLEIFEFHTRETLPTVIPKGVCVSLFRCAENEIEVFLQQFEQQLEGTSTESLPSVRDGESPKGLSELTRKDWAIYNYAVRICLKNQATSMADRDFLSGRVASNLTDLYDSWQRLEANGLGLIDGKSFIPNLPSPPRK